MENVLHGSVAIHIDEIVSLSAARSAQMRSPCLDLSALARMDNRLLAHFDALNVAGQNVQVLLDGDIKSGSRDAAFALTVWAAEGGHADCLDRLSTLAIEIPRVRDGVMTALGWVERRHLRSVVRDLLTATNPTRQAIGLDACAAHGTDPGLESGPWLTSRVGAIRAKALRVVGELGLSVLAPRCAAATEDGDGECQFWAAWGALLLGNRGVALDTLRRTAVEAGRPHRHCAFRLTLQALDLPSAHVMLQDVAKDAAQLRWLIEGSGIAGDAAYVPWLIGHMATPETARVAGAAFTLITGADLDALQLWRAEPNDFESGPSENPEDENVDIDSDEGLMWPDPQKVEQWWGKHGSRFQKGTRYFMGATVTREHCMGVLKNGDQRQRVLAAHYLCLLNPGTPLFNTSAPAWRQQKLLAQMS